MNIYDGLVPFTDCSYVFTYLSILTGKKPILFKGVVNSELTLEFVRKNGKLSTGNSNSTGSS